ncbi:MAG: hypothetical protein WBD40_09050 [Tepidisphaeraceae bacterium]
MVYLLVAACAAALPGCAQRRKSPAPSPSPTTQPTSQPQGDPAPPEPISRQLPRTSEPLRGKRFSGLTHFERDSDALFASAKPSAPRIDATVKHTGKSSLLLVPGTRRMTIKLSSLLVGRDFPGDWTLVGLYLRADEATALAISCADDGKLITGRKVSLVGGDWTPAFLDVAALPAAPGGDVTLELRFDEPARANVHVDDVVLVDNRQTLVDAAPNGWTVKRAGLRVTCEHKLRFNFGVVTKDGSPEGWEVEEANDLRARFASTGKTKALAVYADGRSVWDGAYKPLSAEVRDDPAFAAAHASPADVTVPETVGRVNRNTPGDANNDGYNEVLGAYQLQASGARLEATLSPRTTLVPRPILQIAGLPHGKALITIEGRLVERSTRLPDGQLLVELPARITRPTLVTIRIQ